MKSSSLSTISQVTPEAKKKSLEAKARGEDAFKRKDYHMAIDAYTQVAFVPYVYLLLAALCKVSKLEF